MTCWYDQSSNLWTLASFFVFDFCCCKDCKNFAFLQESRVHSHHEYLNSEGLKHKVIVTFEEEGASPIKEVEQLSDRRLQPEANFGSKEVVVVT